MSYLQTKHILPGEADEIVKFWWAEKKYTMTRREAEAFLELEVKKGPIQPKDLQKELEIRDVKIEELTALVNQMMNENALAKELEKDHKKK